MKQIKAIAKRYASDWYTINPKYRTKKLLAELIKEALLKYDSFKS